MFMLRVYMEPIPYNDGLTLKIPALVFFVARVYLVLFQEVPLLPVDIGGPVSTPPGPVYGAAGVPPDVFKTAYRGDLFGTGGDYMGG